MKIKLMIGFLFISSSLYGMKTELYAKEDNNTINLRTAILYELSKKNEDEIVICRLNLSSPSSNSTLEEHIRDRQAEHTGTACKVLDGYMKPIVEEVADSSRKIECWTRISPFTQDHLNQAEFIVYSIPPSMERDRNHPSAIRVFKRFKKPFIIAIRENGEDVVVKDLKEDFPNDRLIVFPRERQNFYYVIFGISAAVIISLLCYFKWVSK